MHFCQIGLPGLNGAPGLPGLKGQPGQSGKLIILTDKLISFDAFLIKVFLELLDFLVIVYVFFYIYISFRRIYFNMFRVTLVVLVCQAFQV